MSKKEDDPSIASQPLNSHSDMSLEVSYDLQLALLLQASAEMFSKRHYERATELLSLCNLSASPTGTPVQRVVYCYSEAQRERINKEKKSITGLQLDRLVDFEVKPIGVEELSLCPKPHVIACYHALPFYQVAQFACIEAILDNGKSERRLHLIDFGIRSGAHWTILMQALANRGDCPLDLLKITAIGTYKQVVDQTGKRLSSFAAENMNCPFFFNAVVSEMKDLSKDLFELDTNEVVEVYSEYVLGGMLAWPNHLEVVLRFIESLNPCVIMVIETEANINKPIFMDRFNESVFLYATLFDCLETFMGPDNQHRMEFERLETELSESSLYQANLMVDRSAHGFCTLDMDGNCLTIKWKGTPIVFASAWKFVHD
ncbi:DELLA protein RGL2-like [Solanum pennellii]|uniref:DELLA protein RGL2-like n=1 Tax=Solanum pennellii TaxID=28526 RepID=A0ABM1H3I9_SOLPN|nr:DELLA protein RGL2-like [Solanum pennellii]